MNSSSRAFFTVDHGTASISATLVAHVGGRFRLLAAASMPSVIAADDVLGELVARVDSADAEALPDSALWREWPRLEAASIPPPRVVCAAPDEPELGRTVRVFEDAGWEVASAFALDHLDPIRSTEACLAHDVRVVAVAAPVAPRGGAWARLAELCTIVGAAVGRRSDARLVAAGGAREFRALLGGDTVLLAGAAGGAPGDAASAEGAIEPLEDVARALLAEEAPRSAAGVLLPDVRRGLSASLASLAVLLDRSIELIEIGHSAGMRASADRVGEQRSVVRADGALIPGGQLDDDRLVDSILRWSTTRGDLLPARDRVRNLWVAPGRDATGDGARLRTAAARASLRRLDAAWTGPPDGDEPFPELVIVSGGVFASAPAPAVALAILDTVRRRGAMALAHDHARLLGPLGTLPKGPERARLLSDLLGDALIPLATAIITGGARGGRGQGLLRLSLAQGTTEIPVEPGSVRFIDLAPGASATAELPSRGGGRDGPAAASHGERLVLQISGALGGVLLDTREVPLRLPERAERRRDVLDAWERSAWSGLAE